MDGRGQAAIFDTVLVILAISVFVAATSGFLGGGDDELKTRIRGDFTQSLLVSLMECSASGNGSGMVGDRVALYFEGRLDSNALEDELSGNMGLYTEKDWVFYSDGGRALWIPEGKVLQGRDISSASMEFITSENETVRFFLFLGWD